MYATSGPMTVSTSLVTQELLKYGILRAQLLGLGLEANVAVVKKG